MCRLTRSPACFKRNAALLPFEQIITTAEKLLALADAYRDATEGIDTIHITDVRLGYMRVMRKDQPDQLMLIPVWDFFGYIRPGQAAAC